MNMSTHSVGGCRALRDGSGGCDGLCGGSGVNEEEAAVVADELALVVLCVASKVVHVHDHHIDVQRVFQHVSLCWAVTVKMISGPQASRGRR